MIVEVKSTGVRFEHDWEQHEVQASSLAEAAYKAIRKTHDFLTDDNHTFEFGPLQFMWGGEQVTTEPMLRILKNENSPRFAWCPWWVTDGPGETWFSYYVREFAPVQT